MKNVTLSGMPRRNGIQRFFDDRKKLVIEISSLLLFILFAYTAASKFQDFKMFVLELNNQPFPDWMTPFLAWGLPSVELLIAAALIFGKTKRIGFLASFVIMFLFTTYTALVLLHVFKKVPCSCGGVISMLSWKQHLIFNLFFLALATIGIRLTKSRSES
jgi:putative oxidoreductase